MNERFLFMFVAAVLVVAAASPTACARPAFIVMDVTKPEAKPELFGYRLSAVRGGIDVQFTVDLDSAASEALVSATVFFSYPAARAA